MSPTAINAFRLKCAGVIHTAHDVAVTFRGASVGVILSPVAVSLDLETGGLNAGGEYTCRFLQTTLATAPIRGEQVTFSGRKYSITEIKDTISTPNEYVVTIKAGSKL